MHKQSKNWSVVQYPLNEHKKHLYKCSLYHVEKGKREGSLSFLFLARNLNLKDKQTKQNKTKQNKSLMCTCKSYFNELQLVLRRCHGRSFLYDVMKRQTKTSLRLTKFIFAEMFKVHHLSFHVKQISFCFILFVNIISN